MQRALDIVTEWGNNHGIEASDKKTAILSLQRDETEWIQRLKNPSIYSSLI